MGEQTIISISREYGSGGHDIAVKLAERFDMHLYDRQLLRDIAEKKHMDIDTLRQFDEHPRNPLLSRRVGSHTNSMEDILAEIQFQYIREKAESGESFVIVGRCADFVLRDFPGLITIFVTGEREYRIDRIMSYEELSDRAAAARRLETIDRRRRQYHNHYADQKWGDSRHYDLCINASPLGVSGTARILAAYVKERMKR